MAMTWRGAAGVLAAVVLAGAVTVGAVTAIVATGAEEPAGGVLGAAPVPAQLQPNLRVAAPSGDPLETAGEWLQATLALSAADPEPTAWLDRVAPVVTGPLAAQHRDVRDLGSAGAGWDEFVARGCSTTVVDLGGTIPPEAPRTPSTVYVQIAGQQVTSCRGDELGRPAAVDPVAATLELQLGDGLWRVAQRLA